MGEQTVRSTRRFWERLREPKEKFLTTKEKKKEKEKSACPEHAQRTPPLKGQGPGTPISHLMRAGTMHGPQLASYVWPDGFRRSLGGRARERSHASFSSSSSKCLRSGGDCRDAWESSKLREECAKEGYLTGWQTRYTIVGTTLYLPSMILMLELVRVQLFHQCCPLFIHMSPAMWAFGKEPTVSDCSLVTYVDDGTIITR